VKSVRSVGCMERILTYAYSADNCG
jgi:hypothetical protein